MEQKEKIESKCKSDTELEQPPLDINNSRLIIARAKKDTILDKAVASVRRLFFSKT
jgi:hypothetical protein